MNESTTDDDVRPWMALAEVEALPDGDYYLEERSVLTTAGEKATWTVEYRLAEDIDGPADG